MSEKDIGKAKKGMLQKVENVLVLAKRNIGKVPFIPDALAMYYCMLDEETPLWVKTTIAGALVYFILPVDLIVDFMIPFPVGYSDDAGVIATAFSAVKAYVTPEHIRQAKAWLAK